MATRHVDLIRKALDAFKEKDADALTEMSSDELEIHPAYGEQLETDSFSGDDAWKDYFSRMGELFEEWRIEDVEILDAGEERVVSLFRSVGQEEESEEDVEHAIGVTYTLRDGEIARVRGYLDPKDALAAAGLPH